ncbi:sulfite exporter TauE/SafE family protein [Leeia sp.]|uniref:sulfite exporter TauE/SafE family protein n=1 Tax=Leeia sp. TaxID=2884678 RepID=UPI0035AFF8EB
MLPPDLLLYFMLLALLAEVVGTVGGFGSSLLFVPLAGYFLDYHSVLGVAALYHLSSNAAKIYFFRAGFDRKLILQMGLPSVLAAIAGALMSGLLPSALLTLLLAGFLIGLGGLLLLFRQFRLRPVAANAVLGGLVSGFLSGLLGTGGAVRGVVLAAYGLPAQVFIATSAIIDFGIDASRSVVYAASGFVHRDDLYLIPLLLGVSVVGTWLGKKIVGILSEQQFQSIVLLLVIAAGGLTLWRAWG